MNLLRALLALVFLFQSGCAAAEYLSEHPLSINGGSDNAAWLARNPEAADLIESRGIPQDDKLHFSSDIHRVSNRAGDSGWQFDGSVRMAWPRVLRPRVPEKTQPPSLR